MAKVLDRPNANGSVSPYAILREIKQSLKPVTAQSHSSKVSRPQKRVVGFNQEKQMHVPFDQFMNDLRKASVKDPNIAWLAKNKEAAESVHRGLEQAKQGKVRSLGSFAEYADDDE